VTPYDAAFLALGAGVFLERSRRSWLVAFAPLLALVLGAMSLGHFHIPMTALVVCLLAPRHASIALILVIPAYGGLFDALRTSVLWLLGTVLVGGLGRKSDASEMAEPSGGTPARLLICGVLYFTLLPTSYL
jgi:hypothetical protein